MIKWFRNSKSDKPKKQMGPVVKPSKPKTPKSLTPKVKKHFIGPQSPGAYKKRLYIPKKFITAAEGDVMTDEEMQALMQEIPPPEPEAGGLEEEEATPVEGGDPVEMAIRSIPNVVSIKWEASPNSNCEWCKKLALLPAWPSADAFAGAKHALVKPGRDTKHLAHDNCSCKLKVTDAEGKVYTVDSAGQF